MCSKEIWARCVYCFDSIGVSWGVFPVIFVIMLPYFSWILPPVACRLIYSPLLWSSSDGIFPNCVIYLMHFFLCCCISSLHWIDFCLRMWWVDICCYLVLCLLDSLCHFLSVIGWFLVLLQVHLFLSIVAWLCHKIPCMYLPLWWILLYQITSGNLHSRPTLFWLMSASLVLCINLLC